MGSTFVKVAIAVLAAASFSAQAQPANQAAYDQVSVLPVSRGVAKEVLKQPGGSADLDLQFFTALSCRDVKQGGMAMAYRLLQMSQVVTHERWNGNSLYMGAFDQKGKRMEIHNMIPSRYFLITKTGGAEDWVAGALLPVQLDEKHIVGAFSAGLKKKISMMNVPGMPKTAGADNWRISEDPIFGANHLGLALLAETKETIAFCVTQKAMSTILLK